MPDNYDQNDIRSIMEKVAMAFIALRDGSNSPKDFNTLAMAMNMGAIRAESIGQAEFDVFDHAKQALLDADSTYDTMKIYTFTQGALVDLAKGVQGYSELLATSTQEQMEACGKESQRRLAAGQVAKHGSVH